MPTAKVRAPEWSERDLLFATTQMTHNLAAWLVMAGIATPDKMSGIVQISANQLERLGEVTSAHALRAVFAGAINGEWANMRQLTDPGKVGGSA